MHRHRLDGWDRAGDGTAARRRGGTRRHLRQKRGPRDRRGVARRGRSVRGRSADDRGRSGRRGARRARRADQQRRLRRPRALRAGAGRGLGFDVAAERDELRARDPRRASAAPDVARRDRERVLDGGQATVGRDAALLGDEGCRALALAPRRRFVCGRRHPLQRRRRRDRPRRMPGLDRVASPTSRAAIATPCSRRSGPAGR